MAPLPADLQPYRQGGLDTMCGPYAVINAVRLVVEPRRRLQRAACVALFGELVDELVVREQLVDALTWGCGTREITRLLNRARPWLQQRYGITLHIERPFSGRTPRKPSELLPMLRRHLGQPGQTAIIATDVHWTVALGVVGNKLMLFDSNRRTYMHLGVVRGRKLSRRLYLRGTFLLRAG